MQLILPEPNRQTFNVVRCVKCYQLYHLTILPKDLKLTLDLLQQQLKHCATPPTYQTFFAIQILSGHVTSRNQDLSPQCNDKGSKGERKPGIEV